jgi:hypothetical protein
MNVWDDEDERTEHVDALVIVGGPVRRACAYVFLTLLGAALWVLGPGRQKP